MELGTCETPEILGQNSLLNGCMSEQSVSTQLEDVIPLEDTNLHRKDATPNAPIRVQDSNEDHELSPKLSHCSGSVIAEGMTLQESQGVALSVQKYMYQEGSDLNFSDGSMKFKTSPDFSDAEQNENCQAKQSGETLTSDSLDSTNHKSVTSLTNVICSGTTVTNTEKNQDISASGNSDSPLTNRRKTDFVDQKSGLFPTRNESETKPFHLNKPHGAISRREDQIHAVGDNIKQNDQLCNNMAPTALNPSETSSVVESVDTTDEVQVDMEVDEKSSDGLKNSDVHWPHLPTTCGPNLAQSEDANDSRVTSPGDLSSNSKLLTVDDADDPTKSAPSQKAPSKLRGNAMIYVPDLSDELMQGYRILTEIFSDKCKSFVWPFLDAVDTETLWDYDLKVKHPMWLRKIESKFVNKEYKNITEFAMDMRQMLGNCYRYNGMKHQISKYAQTLECVFEQKLALLSRPLQEKTTLYVTSDGKYNDGCPNTIELSSGRLRRTCTRLAARAIEQASATPLAFHVRRELEQQEREEKRQKIVDRRDEIIKERQDLLEWDKQMIGETNWTYMKSLWEIPAIGHFLCLCQSALELDEISFFELERSFAIPMESMILRRIFTTLLSTPYQRTRLVKKPPMPYKVWEARLREWVRGWYVVYNKLGDPMKVYEKIGVPERFFEVLGPHFPLDRVQFHELTYYERVWVMKALCDQLFETQLSIRRCILSQPVEEQRPIILGVDGEANSYIHFPQFCGADLRIYRQSKYPDLLKKSKKEKVRTDETEDATEKGDTQRPRKHRRMPVSRKRIDKPKPVTTETPRARPSRLRQKLTPTIHFGTYAESIVSSTESEDVTSEFTEMEDEPDESDSQSEHITTSGELKEDLEEVEEPKNEEEEEDHVVDEQENMKEDSESEERDIVTETLTGEERNQPSHRIGAMKQEQLAANRSLKSSNEKISDQTEISTDETKQLCNGETSSHSSSSSENASTENVPKPCDEPETKDGDYEGAEKCVDPSSDNGMSNQSAECSANQEDPIKLEGGSETGGNVVAEAQNSNNNSSLTADALLCELKPSIGPDDEHHDTTLTKGESVPPPSSPLKPHVEVLPVLGEFEMICDSMDSLRELVDRFGPPESRPVPPTSGRKRKAAAYAKQPLRKRCEKDLHEKLTNLLLELTPWEAKLAKFAMRNREKFKKEYEVAKATPETDQDIKDIWASEESSSESESSDSESEEEEEEEQPAEDRDEDWDASSEGMRLRKRSVKKVPAPALQDEDKDEESVQDDAVKKPKRPRPNSKRKPPHKNQLNTSLLELIKNLSTDGLKDACRRLQTMIKRGEATRNQVLLKSKIDTASLAGCGDEQAVTAFLHKLFWVTAKPPLVEGSVAKTVEELISTYPTFVHNLIFRNLKNGLNRMSNAANSTSPGSADLKKEPESKEEIAVPAEPPQEPTETKLTDADSNSDAHSSSSRMETRFSVSTTPQETILKLGSKMKTKEVMDDFVLAGLYTVLARIKGILRERLATGLSELLPDYPNLQESTAKTGPVLEKQHGESVHANLPSPRSETDKELLLKMLPKPSEYLKNPKLTGGSSAHAKYMSNLDVAGDRSSTRPANSLLVPVPTAKLPIMPKSRSKKGSAKGEILPNAKLPATTSTPQPASNSGSVPHGVYTIKVDANVWSQLQGKPQLQQQFVLQQIKEMQRKQAESGPSSTSTGALNNPAQAVTCIRSPPKSQLAAQKTTAQTQNVNVPPKNTSRVVQAKDLPNLSDLSSLKPIKLNKPARPKTSGKGRSGFGEPASNLSQKELIALLQQQQRQLELHRQQQQQKLLIKQKEEQQQQAPPQTSKQHFVLSASGALLSATQQQQVHGALAPKAPENVINASPSPVVSMVPSSQNTSVKNTVVPSLSTQPTRLSTKTTVTPSVKQPKMTVSLINSQPCGFASSAATTLSTPSGRYAPTTTQVTIPPNPTSVSSSPKSPGTRLHLVQTSSGTQFILRTGSSQVSMPASHSSAGIIGSADGTLPVVVAGQNMQFMKQANQAAAVVVSSASHAARSSAPQAVQFMMQPRPAIPNAASLSVPQGLQQLVQPGQAVSLQLAQGSGHHLYRQAAASSLQTEASTHFKQAGAQINQDVSIPAPSQGVGQQVVPTIQNPQGVAPLQFGQSQMQTTPTIIQKSQPAILRSLGDSKVVVGSPTKVVRLVYPSHLSTAATFVPTSDQGQLGRSPTKAVQVVPQGVKVLSQTPGNQQLVHLPIQPSKVETTVALPLSTPVSQVSTSVSGVVIQEHLQQVIMQQLASGKLKLSPQTIPVSTVSPQISQQQQASVQQLNSPKLVKTLPVVLSQQVPQLVTKIQPSVPASVMTNPLTAVAGVQIAQQSVASIPQSVQILNQVHVTQAPAVRLVAANGGINQAHPLSQELQRLQLVNAASSVTGSMNAAIQMPTVLNRPSQITVHASHLVQAQPSVSPGTNQAMPAHVVLKTTPVALSGQQIQPPQGIIQMGGKRTSPTPIAAVVAKVPRLTASGQAPSTQTVPITLLSGFTANTTQGSS